MSMGDTRYLLEQWGWWRMHSSGIPRYVSPAYALMRDNMGSTVPTGCITDDLALAVDRVIARLCIRDQQMGDCIWMTYGAKQSTRRIAAVLGIGETKASQLIRAGEAWIDGALDPEPVDCARTAG